MIAQPPPALIRQYNALNERCRDGDASDASSFARTMKVCRARDRFSLKLTRVGWCWGPDASPEYMKRWVRCRP